MLFLCVAVVSLSACQAGKTDSDVDDFVAENSHAIEPQGAGEDGSEETPASEEGVATEAGKADPVEEPVASATVAPATPEADNTYRIGVDDVVQVSVWRNEDLSVTVPVRPDGMISVPLVGDVAAGGLTPEAVAAGIEKELSYFVRNPKVSVILTQLESHAYLSRVRVTGAVINPISIPYRQGMTVLDLVLEAGGVNEFASGNKTRLYRDKDGKTTRLNVHLKDILRYGKLDTNYDLQPGDVITVPERIF